MKQRWAVMKDRIGVMMRQSGWLLHEPLVHFIVLGAMLFALFALASRPGATPPGRIVVTQGRIAHLSAGFEATRRRAPSAEELQGLIRNYIREEVYYREALAMGLDRDDAVIRRRLQQKLEFVSEDVASLADAADADLEALMRAHPERFRTEQRVSFRHVYLDPRRHPGTLARDGARLLARLKNAGTTAEVSELGDAFLLDNRFDAVPASEVAKLFGEKFAAALSDVPLAEWQGPIESGYGQHFVLVSKRTEPRLPALDEVRENVRREWASLERRKADEQFYQELLARYEVVVENPQLADSATTPASITQR